MKSEAPDLRCRIALRLPEAAAALGCSESTLRRVLPELEGCVFRVGATSLISVEGLRRWSLNRAQQYDTDTRTESANIAAALGNVE